MRLDSGQTTYFDFLARAICVVEKFPLPSPQLNALTSYQTIFEKVKKELDEKWKLGLHEFFAYMESKMKTLEQEFAQEHFVEAKTISIWMDQMISYARANAKNRVSCNNLIPKYGDAPLQFGALNSNYREIGIEIHPKFESAVFWDTTTGTAHVRPLASRDAFEGINGELNNILYSHWREGLSVENIVFPQEFDLESNTFRVAFAPMSDNGSLLECQKIPIEKGGLQFQGIFVEKISNTSKVVDRLKADWQASYDHHVDVLFFPEMLGTTECHLDKGTVSQILKPLAQEALAQGKRPPIITALPSHWSAGDNTVTVVDQMGQSVGYQEKHIPYVSKKNSEMEALNEHKDWHILLLHIPNAHRIVISICAEFLDERHPFVEKLICGELGATMVLVPSYSEGEQDFINQMGRMKCYGTTVIWGNCCGAIPEKRVIGGCAIAGIDRIHRFSTYCKCNGSCAGHNSCLYTVDIPLRLSREKPWEPQWERSVAHQLT